INKAFGKGFKQFDGKAYFLDTVNKYRSGKKSLGQLGRALGRMVISTEYSKNAGKEKGYVYLQDFLPNNEFDLRIIIIGNKAFALKRMVRKGDFRASGSGSIIYNTHEIDIQCVQTAFKVSKKLKAECLAYDFIYNQNKNPLIVEI